MGRQLWIAEQARAWGLTVEEVPGWRERGKESFNPGGVVCHHTAGPANGDMPSLKVLINGRADLPGPLCNVGLARSGVVYVVAAGRANHAGRGTWRGLTGNSSVFGIEAENTGLGEPWPQVQLDAYVRLTALLLAGARRDATFACAHREWRSEKPDPRGVEMEDFRNRVAQALAAGAQSVAVPSTPAATPAPTSEVERIKELQRLVGTTDDGDFGTKTEAACRQHMIGWPQYVTDHAPRLVDDLHGNRRRELVQWLQRQGNRRFNFNLAEDGDVGPATNHLIVVGLGQADGVCGPTGFREAVR